MGKIQESKAKVTTRPANISGNNQICQRESKARKAEVENQTPTDVTVKQEVDKITVEGTGKNWKKSVFQLRETVAAPKGEHENVRLSALSSVCDALKGITSRIMVKADKKL